MELMKLATLILTILVVGTCATTNGVQEFLVDNGHYHVDIFSNSSQLRGVSLKDLFIARFPMEDVEKAHKDSFGIFMFDNAKDNVVSYLSAITQRQIKMSLLVISEPWDNEKISFMRRHLLEQQATAFFYIAIPTGSHTDMTWHQIISLKSGSALNHLEFDDNSSKIIEAFDMHGLEITSSSLTWAPYLTIDDCNEDGLDCAKNYGYLIDLMDELAIKFNFSYLSQKNTNNSWWHVGTHGLYGGVWGDVESKQYDLSLSAWKWMISRHDRVDFVPFIQENYVLAFRPQQPNIDFSLFTRVFVQDIWTSLICISGAMLLAVFLAKMYCIKEVMNGIEILTFVWWLLFTLVNSYYCGVLTMFFATPTSAPFKTMRDVLKAHQDWNLLFEDGSRGFVHSMAGRGDPDFLSLWQWHQENPLQTTFDSVEHGLELIEKGQNVILIGQNRLLGHLKSHQTKQKIHTVKIMNPSSNSILFHNNSPLVPMFNKGVSYLTETGLRRQLYYKWFGKFSEEYGYASSEGNILTLGQMVTVFLIMLVVFVVALLILCGELTFKQFFSGLTMHGQRRDKM